MLVVWVNLVTSCPNILNNFIRIILAWILALYFVITKFKSILWRQFLIIIFLASTEIILQCETGNAQIFYTLDGSEPTERFQRNRAPFELENTTLRKFMAIKKGLQPSLTVTEKLNKLGEEAI